MEKEIEKAIRETLVIDNPQSIYIAVKKILLLFSVSGRSEQVPCKHNFVDFHEDYKICTECDECVKKKGTCH